MFARSLLRLHDMSAATVKLVTSSELHSSGGALWPNLVRAAAATLIALSFGPPASAQKLTPGNIELCNGTGLRSPEPQIEACSALIDSDIESQYVLAVAFNNRGNAYSASGNYERAIADYTYSIKLKPDHARTFNNRGVA